MRGDRFRDAHDRITTPGMEKRSAHGNAFDKIRIFTGVTIRHRDMFARTNRQNLFMLIR